MLLTSAVRENVIVIVDMTNTAKEINKIVKSKQNQACKAVAIK